MIRQRVVSSAAFSIGYDPDNMFLDIEYKPRGDVWRYFNVPENVFLDMMSSGSIGKYINTNIKGQYPESQL